MSEWREYKLGEIAEVLDYKRKPISSMERIKRKGAYPYYGASGIIDYLNDYIFDGEYVLISEDGENLYSRQTPIAFLAEGQFWVNNHAHVIKSDYVHNRLICYYFANMDLNPYLTGAVQPKLSQNSLVNIPLLLPKSIDKRKKIVSIFSSLDDKIDLLHRENKTLEAMAETLFRKWFVEEAKEDWKEVLLEDIAYLSAGGDKPKKVSYNRTNELNIPIYSNGVENEGLYGYTDIPKITEESVTISARGTIGYVVLRTEPFVPIVRLITLTPKKHITSKYLYFWAKSQDINGTGTTQQQLTIPDFKLTKVLLPGEELISKFTNEVNQYYKKILLNKKQIQTLTQTRDSLLPKLMSGEIKV